MKMSQQCYFMSETYLFNNTNQLHMQKFELKTELCMFSKADQKM